MFDWLNPDGKLIVKLPFEIYFGATILLMIILILFMSLRKWLCRAVDLLPHGTLQLRLRTSRFYQDAKKDNEREEISDSGTSAKAGATNNVGTRGETTGRNSATNGTFQKVAESRTRSAISLSIAEQGVYGVHGGG
jgi:hypothetical protein